MRAKPNQRIEAAKGGNQDEVEMGAHNYLQSATNDELLHLSSQAIGYAKDD